MLYKKQSAVFLAVLTAVMSLGLSGCDSIFKKDDGGWKGGFSSKGDTS